MMTFLVLAGISNSTASAGGHIISFGDNTYDQCSPPPIEGSISAVAAGLHHTMGLLSDGSVLCWGRGSEGQCTVPSPNIGFVGVSGGFYHSAGLLSNGSVLCWGSNTYGQCSVPDHSGEFTAVAAGGYHTVGLLANGSVICWGRDNNGQCSVPSPNRNFTAIAAGSYITLGIRDDGSIACWGDDTKGLSHPPPGQDFIAVAGGRQHALALRSNGTIECWGSNAFGQCDVPPVTGGFAAIAAGAEYSAGLLADGSIVCWGRNEFGQCTVPEPNTSFHSLCAGHGHTVAIQSFPLHAEFTADPRCGSAPLNVLFTDLSSGEGITLHRWDFGNGNHTTYREPVNPSHLYTSEGVYRVSLSVANTSTSDTAVRDAYITVTAPAPAPSSILPREARPGTVIHAVIKGKFFLPGARVHLVHDTEQVDATGTLFSPATGIRCLLTLPHRMAPGWWDLTVVNPDGSRGTLRNALLVKGPPVVSVSDITPKGGPLGKSGTITMKGKNLSAVTEITLRHGERTLGARPARVAATRISVPFSLPWDAEKGPWDVVITDRYGSRTVLENAFEVWAAPRPFVTSLSRRSGTSDGNRYVVSIKGGNFTAGMIASLCLNGTSIPGKTTGRVMPGLLRSEFRVPWDADHGEWEVIVTHPLDPDMQSARAPVPFHVTSPRPLFTSVTPRSGERQTMVTLTIEGRNFVPGTQVFLSRPGSIIGGSCCQVRDSGSMTCVFTLPEGPCGAWDILLANGEGRNTTARNAFRVR